MALFPIIDDKVQFSTDAIEATDTFRNGVVISADDTKCRASLTGGVEFCNGLLLSSTGQVIFVDATSGLPLGTTYVNGIPISPAGAVCVSSDPMATYSNGLPYTASGALCADFAVNVFAGAAAAYSLRIPAGSQYTGPLIRVRRAFDNVEQDIGAVLAPDANGNKWLDTDALMAHVGYPNLLLHSEAFENAAWAGLTGGTETIAANSEIAPDGTLTADRCTVSSSGSGRFQNITLAAAGQITCSVYIKAGSTGTWGRFGLFDTASPGNQARCWVNMTTGELGTVAAVGSGWSGVTASSTPAGNDWYRISVTATCAATVISVLITNADLDNSTIRTIGHNRLMWGAQLHTGSALQPYSATTTTARDGNGFVTTWYDQSGNARNAVQTTAATQPRIVNAGVVDSISTFPALRFSNASLAFTNATSQPLTINIVHRLSTVVSGGHLTDGVIATTRPLLGTTANYVQFAGSVAAIGAASAGITRVLTGVFNDGSSSLALDGVVTATNPGTQGMAGQRIGASQTGVAMNGWMPEYVVFNSALSDTDRQTLERSQGTAFGITVA
jgi:hypothetical protein